MLAFFLYYTIWRKHCFYDLGSCHTHFFLFRLASNNLSFELSMLWNHSKLSFNMIFWLVSLFLDIFIFFSMTAFLTYVCKFTFSKFIHCISRVSTNETVSTFPQSALSLSHKNFIYVWYEFHFRCYYFWFLCCTFIFLGQIHLSIIYFYKISCEFVNGKQKRNTITRFAVSWKTDDHWPITDIFRKKWPLIMNASVTALVFSGLKQASLCFMQFLTTSIQWLVKFELSC